MKALRLIQTARAAVIAGGVMLLAGCETPRPYDYSAFIAAKPKTIVVLPPTNESPEITATPGVWARSTKPLAEAGYYVLPVTLVNQTFSQNGVQQPADAHQIPYTKLREVFGADAALYLQVKRYGTRYAIISSATEVEVLGRLIDLRTGKQLWDGKAAASSAEGQSGQQQGLAGLLVKALIGQIVETATDASFIQAERANDRLLTSRRNGGILPGPRSPNYGKTPGTK